MPKSKAVTPPAQAPTDLQAVADFAEDFISMFDRDFRHVFVNRKLAAILKRPAAELIGKTLPEIGMPPDLCALWHEKLRQVLTTGQAVTFESTMSFGAGRLALESLLAPVPDADGAVRAVTAITRDISAWKRDQALRNAQNEVMRELGRGAELGSLMATIVRLAEANAPGRLCSLLLLSADGRYLQPGHAPQLPAELITALCARPVSPDNGSCGAAVSCGQPVFADDLARHPAWTAHRTLAARHGLHAAWSQPILSPAGALLGAFAMYHTRRPRPPTERERLVLNESALIAGVVIQHCREHESLLESETRYRILTENAANIVVVNDAQGVIRYVSPAVEPILGYRPDELVGRPGGELVHPDDLPLALEARSRLHARIGSQDTLCYRYRHKDGSWRLLEATAKSSLDHRGEYVSVVSARDVTERERTTRALKQSEERLERALDASGLGMWDWNVETGELYVDSHFSRSLGYDLAEIPPRVDWLMGQIHPDDLPRVMKVFITHLKGLSERAEVDFRGRAKNGDYRWIRTVGSVTARRADGWALRLTGTNQDIDAQRRAQANLDRANTRMQLLMEATDEGIIGLDPEGVCTFVNPAATRLLGLAGEQLLGKPFDTLVRHTADDGAELIGHDSPMVRCLLEGQRFVGANELFWRDAQSAVPVEYSVSPLFSDGQAAGAVLIFRDVSEKRALAQQLQHQATHDPLTGLVNRHGFEKELGLMLYTARTHKKQHALCYVDLDHFKLVNDTCGHAAGDELLRQLPAVLKAVVRKNDTVARLGGDEFGILLEDCPLEEAARVAESVRDAVRDFRFVWQYRSFTIGASIGVVAITSDSLGLVSVLGAADAACYVAKDQGPNHVHVSYPHDLAIIRRRGEMRWVARIKTALEENQFRLHYQSIAALDNPDEAPNRHELLLRLVDAKGDLIMPGAFLQAAERYQLMPAIDQWVIDNALRFVGAAVRAHPGVGSHAFGINLSGESLRDLGLLDNIKAAIKRHAVPPASLYFELTETAAISNLGAAVEFMRGLKDLGCKLALDDFGSGMSSFSYLKHLPVDYLKIDGSFIKDIVNNPVDQAIVRAVTAVGRQMGIQTIAEYVETKAIRDCLVAMGVNYGQGYNIARPMPLESFAQTQRPAAASA